MLALLKRIDDLVYRIERIIVAGSLAVMSLVVFADVVHRAFADPESKLARWLVAGLRLFGVEAARGEALYPTLRDYVAPPLLFLLFVLLVAFAIRSAVGSGRFGRARVFGAAVAGVALAWLAIRLFVWLVPSGVVWAQTLALVLTLWVGFAGASLCTYEGKHLRVEIADRIWRGRAGAYVRLLANVLTAAFVFFLFGLAVGFIEFQYEEYVQTEGFGGTFEGLRILPKWVAFLILPLSFFIMGARFLAAGISAVRGGRYGRSKDALEQALEESGRAAETSEGAA
ncbi:MAG: TRAP transporter small permease [Deltaproteobacteria bacterium]|nr:MAG: TRAP transporter small permease [Deltaproteobacteria bacterium]